MLVYVVDVVIGRPVTVLFGIVIVLMMVIMVVMHRVDDNDSDDEGNGVGDMLVTSQCNDVPCSLTRIFV